MRSGEVMSKAKGRPLSAACYRGDWDGERGMFLESQSTSSSELEIHPGKTVKKEPCYSETVWDWKMHRLGRQ